MNFNPLKKQRHCFAFESPYTINEITSILKKNVSHDSDHKLSSRSYALYQDEKPFIGTYDEQGFEFYINPAKASGILNKIDVTKTIVGHYRTNNGVTTITVTIDDDLGTKIFTTIMLIFITPIWLISLSSFHLLGFCISSLFLAIALFYANQFSRNCKYAECRVRELLS